MKTDEIKLRMVKFAEETIDLYVPANGFFDKLKNSTMKLWVHQNAWRLNKILDAFSDQNGEINGREVISEYENTLFENGEFRLDVKKMIPEEYSTISEILPDKIVIFRKEDLHKLFREEYEKENDFRKLNLRSFLFDFRGFNAINGEDNRKQKKVH